MALVRSPPLFELRVRDRVADGILVVAGNFSDSELEELARRLGPPSAKNAGGGIRRRRPAEPRGRIGPWREPPFRG